MSWTGPSLFLAFLAVLFGLGILNHRACLKNAPGWIILHLILSVIPGAGLIVLVVIKPGAIMWSGLALLTLASYVFKQDLETIAERRRRGEPLREAILAAALVVAGTLGGFFGALLWWA